MLRQIKQHQKEERLFFTRQPIFNSDNVVWGHRLIPRDAPWTVQDQAGPDGGDVPVQFTNFDPPKHAPKTYAYPPGQIGPRKVLVRFSQDAILQNGPRALPAASTVIEIRESDFPGSDYLWTLDALKRDRYRIAIDDFEGDPAAQPLLDRADVVAINVRGKSQQQVAELTRKAHGRVLIAKGVESKKHFVLAKSLGFTHFQGSFFRKADPMPGRELSSNEIARFKLFRIIEAGHPDFNKLSETISMDASISYRLLVFLNSAAFSFPVEITSITHALVILGWEQVKTWLRMAVLTDLTPPKKSVELARLAAQRANFFKLTAQRNGYRDIAADELFLFGLFSLLEPLLDIPIAEIVENLPLSETLKAGLCQELKIYRIWLELAQRIEAADWENLDRVMAYLKLDPAQVATSYYDACVMTNSFFGASNSH
jgi:EAL and modified HD-GYP domain-containing signal transduction protein